MPNREKFLADLSGGVGGEAGEAAALADMRAVVRVWRPLLAQWRREYEELDLEDTRQV